jgi:hypothetical protein
MRITKELLAKHDACRDQLKIFCREYPAGLIPTVANLSEAAALGLDVWWAACLLPAEGPGSQRAYALWCAQQVAHLCSDGRVAECLEIVSRRVADPTAVDGARLTPAWAAAWAAAREAARQAARQAAGAAAWAAAREAAGEVAGAAAWAAAGEAARQAAGAAAWAAAWAAAGEVAGAAARQAQLACLSQLLMEAP